MRKLATISVMLMISAGAIVFAQELPGGRCDRQCLSALVDSYLAAVVAHDPGRLALAPAVRCADENREVACRVKGRPHLRIGAGSDQVADPNQERHQNAGRIRLCMGLHCPHEVAHETVERLGL